MVDSISLLSSNGAFLSSIIVSIGVVLYYFFEKKNKGMLAAIGPILSFGLLPSNRLKYAVVPLLALFIAISLSKSEWGYLDDLLFTTIIGIFGSLGLYWIIPVLIGENYTISVLAALIPILIFGILQLHRNNLSLSKKLGISVLPGIILALIFSKAFGISHVYWGLGIIVGGIGILISYGTRGSKRYLVLGLALLMIGSAMVLEDTLGYLTHNVAESSILIGIITILTTITFIFRYKSKWRL